ncbi:Hypothetical protein CAP_8015 [Chondromyces apiculatus DSM 436]|uniref:Uncharacterized protein n=1 Tax=Chondromyces apiculatus DSM 436 TaxID=1192034 RepID=A0A017SYB4_9BACT|nr:Hypothetical protein CAP_8015 [Chondromyces apiculatus DSM 436]
MSPRTRCAPCASPRKTGLLPHDHRTPLRTVSTHPTGPGPHAQPALTPASPHQRSHRRFHRRRQQLPCRPRHPLAIPSASARFPPAQRRSRRRAAGA